MPEPKNPTTGADSVRAQELAEAIRRDWGFDFRSPRGVAWLARVISELRSEVIHGR